MWSSSINGKPVVYFVRLEPKDVVGKSGMADQFREEKGALYPLWNEDQVIDMSNVGH